MLAPFVTWFAQARLANPQFTEPMAGLPRSTGAGAIRAPIHSLKSSTETCLIGVTRNRI
jgi:hypothetical protein